MTFFNWRKPQKGVFARFLQSAACIICSPEANKFHTCSLSGIFVHVHAAAENDWILFAAYGGKLCEAFCIFRKNGHILFPEVKRMKEDEKKKIPWEAADPKPPVIQSGHLESRKQN